MKLLHARSYGKLNAHRNKNQVFYICDVLRNLVPFVQFKKREKYLWYQIDKDIHLFPNLKFPF